MTRNCGHNFMVGYREINRELILKLSLWLPVMISESAIQTIGREKRLMILSRVELCILQCQFFQVK